MMIEIPPSGLYQTIPIFLGTIPRYYRFFNKRTHNFRAIVSQVSQPTKMPKCRRKMKEIDVRLG